MTQINIKSYPTDLTPTQLVLLDANMQGALSRQRKHDPQRILEAIAYVLKTGCQWAMLPRDFPHWKTVYHHFRSLSAMGWFDDVLRVLASHLAVQTARREVGCGAHILMDGELPAPCTKL